MRHWVQYAVEKCIASKFGSCAVMIGKVRDFAALALHGGGDRGKPSQLTPPEEAQWGQEA